MLISFDSQSDEIHDFSCYSFLPLRLFIKKFIFALLRLSNRGHQVLLSGLPNEPVQGNNNNMNLALFTFIPITYVTRFPKNRWHTSSEPPYHGQLSSQLSPETLRFLDENCLSRKKKHDGSLFYNTQIFDLQWKKLHEFGLLSSFKWTWMRPQLGGLPHLETCQNCYRLIGFPCSHSANHRWPKLTFPGKNERLFLESVTRCNFFAVVDYFWN